MFVDPMQITLANSADNALLESLSSDSNDISAFLQRLPSNDNDDDNVIENVNNGTSNGHTVDGIIFQISDGSVSYIQPHNNQLSKIYLHQLESPPEYTQLSNNIAFEMSAANGGANGGGGGGSGVVATPVQIQKALTANTIPHPLAITIPSPNDARNPSPGLHDSMTSPTLSSGSSGITRRHSPCNTETTLQQNQRINVIKERVRKIPLFFEDF